MTGRKNGLRAARNLLLCCLLALMLWIFLDYPMSMEMDFRRCERQRLAERSEIIWDYDSNYSGDRKMLVGIAPRTIHTYAEGGRFCIWPRNTGGSTLVALPESTRYNLKASSYTDPSFLAIDPPPRAETAQLTITLNVNDWTEDYTLEGQKQGDVFFFQLERRYNYPSEEEAAFNILEWTDAEELSRYPYTLEFFDHEGNLLEFTRNEGWLANK